MAKMIKGSITCECCVNFTVNEQMTPTNIPIDAPPRMTVKKLPIARRYWVFSIDWSLREKLLSATIVLYTTTVIPSFNKDSPNTKKYKLLLTPISWNMANTATGSTAAAQNRRRNLSLIYGRYIRY